MNIAIIYHDADFDGKLSREVCLHWLRKLHTQATLHDYGWDYGRPVPRPHGALQGIDGWEFYDQIYIVDLSVDELMVRTDLRDKIVWIDHHASAIKKWDESGPEVFHGYRIDGVAACRLCWQWFLRDRHRIKEVSVMRLPAKSDFVARSVSEPTLIRLAGEYDIWDLRDPDAKALQFGLRAVEERDLKVLIELQFIGADDGNLLLNSCLDTGHAIKAYCDRQNDEYSAAYSQTIQWEGLTFCALNIGQRGNSDLLRGGLKPEHQACLAWRWDGKQAYMSLYHVEGHTDIDLSLIATKYGGGGHKGACGFRCTLGRLSEIIEFKP